MSGQTVVQPVSMATHWKHGTHTETACWVTEMLPVAKDQLLGYASTLPLSNFHSISYDALFGFIIF